jgi:hypothetical protein
MPLLQKSLDLKMLSKTSQKSQLMQYTRLTQLLLGKHSVKMKKLPNKPQKTSWLPNKRSKTETTT